MIEVELLESRGFGDDDVWISMVLGKDVQWCRLTRRETFVTPSFGGDRFLFQGGGGTVRFEAYRKTGKSRGDPPSPTTSVFGGMFSSKTLLREDKTFLGSCECTPWLERADEPLANFRWLRFETENWKRKGKKRRSSSLGPGVSAETPCFPSYSSPVSRRNQRREIRVAVLTKLGASDKAVAADACRRWFFRPFPIDGLAKRGAYQRANVVRVAVIRCSEKDPCQRPVFVAARVRDSSTDFHFDWPSLAGEARPNNASGRPVASTRVAKDGVFVQRLGVGVVGGFLPDYASLDLAILDTKRTVLGVASVPLGRTEPLDDDDDDDDEEELTEWIDLNGWKLRCSWRLDYDDTRDDREVRPFFDDELYGIDMDAELTGVSQFHGCEEKKILDDDEKNSEVVVRPVNALRVVVARARRITTQSQRNRKPRPRSLCGATVYHYASSVEARSTVARPPKGDGTVTWNECFEFAFEKERVSSAQEEMVRIVVGGDDFPPREVWADAPRHRVSRSWYELGGGAQVLIIAQRYFDDSLVAHDLRDVALDHLALAFPDLDKATVERVYDSTADLADACVALGALAAVRGGHCDDLAHVAASNATDLSWVVSPLVDKVPDPKNVASKLKRGFDSPLLLQNVPDDYDSDDMLLPPNDDEKKRRLLQRHKAGQMIRCSTMTSFMDKKEAVDVVQKAQLDDLAIDYVFRKRPKRTTRGSSLKKTTTGKKKNMIKKKQRSSKDVLDDDDDSVYEDDSSSDDEATVGFEYLDGVPNFSAASTAGDLDHPPSGMDDSDALLATAAVRRSSQKSRVRRRLVVRVRTECTDFGSDEEAKDDTTPKKMNDDKTYLTTVAARWDKTAFELAKVQVEVLRTPRDFATLRAGLVAKLTTDRTPPTTVPPLPTWVKTALHMKAKASTVSIAAGVATASVAGAIAIATGVAPLVAVTGGVALGAVALTGARKTAKASVKAKIDKALAQCRWLQDVQTVLQNWPDGHRKRAAIRFFKQFLAHGGDGTVYQRPRFRSQHGYLDLTAHSDPPSPPPVDYLDVTFDDDATPTNNPGVLNSEEHPPPPPPPVDYVVETAPFVPPPDYLTAEITAPGDIPRRPAPLPPQLLSEITKLERPKNPAPPPPPPGP